MAISAWRYRLMRPASFRGIPFKVEDAARAGGRRQAVFEFPKRDDPYAEDMGRRARRFSVRGYLLGGDYDRQRDALIAAMEQEGAGLLIHYFLGEFQVAPDVYDVTESRQRGGYAEINMQFVESGRSPLLSIGEATIDNLKALARGLITQSAQGADEKAKAASATEDKGISV